MKTLQGQILPNIFKAVGMKNQSLSIVYSFGDKDFVLVFMIRVDDSIYLW